MPQRTPLHQKALSYFLIPAFPLVLVMIIVRLVMTPAFLHFEYTRPDFPADYYGFTTEDRLRYAPYALDYLINAESLNYLADLQFDDGTPLYNARELKHMDDVQIVTQAAFISAIIAGILMLIAGSILWRKNRLLFRRTLQTSSILTLAVIFTIIITAVFNWEFFFTGFHQLFFESGTWYFAYSDTLIRLFPEQFWFDAALLIGGITTLSAFMTLVIVSRWHITPPSQENH
jgi:integral membrane protein (TIGR01906 family)